MKNLGQAYEEAKVSTGIEQLPAGGYICCISKVEDVADKQYLRLEYEIVSGDFANHWQRVEEAYGFWGGKFIRSYKETAIGMFKGFIKAIEESNSFTWAWDEKALVGQVIGLVLGEEEYIKNNGEIGTRIIVKSTKSVKDIQEGKFKVPEKKCLEQSDAPTDVPNMTPSDIPF